MSVHAGTIFEVSKRRRVPPLVCAMFTMFVVETGFVGEQRRGTENLLKPCWMLAPKHMSCQQTQHGLSLGMAHLHVRLPAQHDTLACVCSVCHSPYQAACSRVCHYNLPPLVTWWRDAGMPSQSSITIITIIIIIIITLITIITDFEAASYPDAPPPVWCVDGPAQAPVLAAGPDLEHVGRHCLGFHHVSHGLQRLPRLRQPQQLVSL